jgi:hypothetical protein
MSPRFLAFMPFIFEWEGGYDNDPDDPGGETKYGIDKRSHPEVDIKNLTREKAQEIYWTDYWVHNRIEGMQSPFAEVFFNACVNCGRGRADKLATASNGSARGFLDTQDAFYRRLASARPASKKYLKGWLNRTAALRKRFSLA